MSNEREVGLEKEKPHMLLFEKREEILAKAKTVWDKVHDAGFFPHELFFTVGLDSESLSTFKKMDEFRDASRVRIIENWWDRYSPFIDLSISIKSNAPRESDNSSNKKGDMEDKFEVSFCTNGVQSIKITDGDTQVEIDSEGGFEKHAEVVSPRIIRLLNKPLQLIDAVNRVLDDAANSDFFSLYQKKERKEYERGLIYPRVSIVTSVMYPNYISTENRGKEVTDENIRGDLAIENTLELIKHGFRVFMINGETSSDFREDILKAVDRLHEESGHVEMDRELHWSNTTPHTGPFRLEYQREEYENYSGARQQGIDLALLRDKRFSDVVVQAEPEKPVAHQINRIVTPIKRGIADIVIPDRGIKAKDAGDRFDSFHGYTTAQAISERKANLAIDRILIETELRLADYPTLDLFGGTRAIAMDNNLLSLFMQKVEIPPKSELSGIVFPEQYLNAVYNPVYLALALGYKVISVPINFSYPEQQYTSEAGSSEFDEKRKKQFEDIVKGSTLFIQYLARERQKMRFGIKSYLTHLKKTHPSKGKLEWAKEKT